MEPDKLVAMANQIAAFFRPYPHEDAVKGVAEHIKAFWTPDMRARLAVRVAEDTHGLEPVVLQAMTRPAPAGESPIKKEAQGPGTLGELASDAG